jgi:hypothetical protein
MANGQNDCRRAEAGPVLTGSSGPGKKLRYVVFDSMYGARQGFSDLALL